MWHLMTLGMVQIKDASIPLKNLYEYRYMFVGACVYGQRYLSVI